MTRRKAIAVAAACAGLGVVVGVAAGLMLAARLSAPRSQQSIR